MDCVGGWGVRVEFEVSEVYSGGAPWSTPGQKSCLWSGGRPGSIHWKMQDHKAAPYIFIA
jgi:hypothetical protein